MSVAFVLPEDAVSGSAPVTFAGMPGVWIPGQPVPFETFVESGAFESLAAMRERIAELALPIAETKVDVAKPISAMSVRELEAKAGELGIELPEGTKDVKRKALEDAIAAELEAVEPEGEA